ncbi:MAG: single-stranded DNA-binding protein [Spirochaetia bacterium]|nr:single-stranded DNA-binding protein [Spirochaetia bacterium]
MNFNELKKQSKLGTLTEKLLKQAEEMGSSAVSENPNVFKLETDKSGVGRAIIRFLPAPPNEDKAIVKLYNHGFQVNGKWLIENCPTTLGNQCPICAKNSELWNSGLESDKEVARTRKRKLSYYSNVYIVSNPADPTLEGSVMVFRYGKKIYDKIIALMKPEFEDDVAVDPFDLWNGANLRLRVKSVAGYPNYDDSVFEEPSELHKDEAKLEEIWKSEHSLQELVSPDKFKSDAELEKRLRFVLGTRGVSASVNEDSDVDSSTTENDILRELEETYQNRSSRKVEESDEDDEDPLARFRDLVD